MTHYFRRAVAWRCHVIVGLVFDGSRVSLLDCYGREVRYLHQRHW
jgi:hypothetical protein